MNSHVRKGFNLLSPFYDFFSTLFFGDFILESQTCFLKEIRNAKSILIFGGGTGKVLESIFINNLNAKICYIDLSEKMIEKARKRKFPHKQVHFICGTENDIPESAKFDAIITPFVLDCFIERKLQQLVIKLDTHLKSDGKWLFSDFNISNNSLLMKWISKLIIKMLYFIFNLFCSLGIYSLADFNQHFQKSGYRTRNEKHFMKGLLVSRIYSKSANNTSKN